MRKQLDDLVDIIQYNFKLDPYGNTLFLFCGRRSDHIKAVHYEGDGFCLLYKDLRTAGLNDPGQGKKQYRYRTSSCGGFWKD